MTSLVRTSTVVTTKPHVSTDGYKVSIWYLFDLYMFLPLAISVPVLKLLPKISAASTHSALKSLVIGYCLLAGLILLIGRTRLNRAYHGITSLFTFEIAYSMTTSNCASEVVESETKREPRVVHNTINTSKPISKWLIVSTPKPEKPAEMYSKELETGPQHSSGQSGSDVDAQKPLFDAIETWAPKPTETADSQTSNETCRNALVSSQVTQPRGADEADASCEWQVEGFVLDDNFENLRAELQRLSSLPAGCPNRRALYKAIFQKLRKLEPFESI